jgi:hypothetical protein
MNTTFASAFEWVLSGDTAVPLNDFESKLVKLQNYYKATVSELNTAAEKWTPGISFQIPEIDDIQKLIGKVDDFFNEGFEKIYPEQIRTAWQVMASIQDNNSQEHVTGLTQLGKNGMITVLMDFFGPVSSLNNEICLPIAWVPNAINMEQQSIRKFEQSTLLNSLIRFQQQGKQAYSIGMLRKNIINKLKPEIKKMIREEESRLDIRQTLESEVEDFFAKGDGAALVLRRSKARLPIYKWLFSAAHRLGHIKIVLIMDESHIAIAGHSTPAQMLGAEIQRKNSKDQSTDEIADEEATEWTEESKETTDVFNTYRAICDNHAAFITVSATNAPYNVLKYEKYGEPIYLEIGEGYCGFAFQDGHDYPLRADLKIQEPEVISIKKMAERIGNPDLEKLNLRALDSAEGFGMFLMEKDWEMVKTLFEHEGFDYHPGTRGVLNRIAKKLRDIRDSKSAKNRDLGKRILESASMTSVLEPSEWFRLFTGESAKKRRTYLKTLSRNDSPLDLGWKKAIKDAMQHLGDLIEYLLIKENPNNKRGCILRWELSIKMFVDFVKPLESRFDGKICLISYMGSAASKTIPQLLKEYNPDALPYVIGVTGRGRYGESYPSDCGYAIDATNKNSTVASFTQSLLGRLTGYGKYDKKNPNKTKPLLILSKSAYDTVYIPWKKGKGFSDSLKVDQHMERIGQAEVTMEVVGIRRGMPELEQMFSDLKAFVGVQETTGRLINKGIVDGLDPFKIISPYLKFIKGNPADCLEGFATASGDNEIEFLMPGASDHQAREYDWHGRDKWKPGNPKTGPVKVALERYMVSGRRFGLKSTRNRDDEKEYLFLGLQVRNDDEIGKVFLWLKKPLSISSSGVMGWRPKVDTIPDKLGKMGN